MSGTGDDVHALWKLEASGTADTRSAGERLERFHAVYAEHREFVRRTLFWLARGDSVDDLLQEVFVKIWGKLDRFRGESALKTWIYRITVNTAYDHLRKSRTIADSPTRTGEYPEFESTEAEESDSVTRDLIRHGIQSLPEKQRAAFVLHYQEELSIEEVARALRLPRGTVKSRLFHARAAFTEFLEQNGVKL